MGRRAIPLRDHFRPTTAPQVWETLHGGWPMVIAQRLNALLPEEYVARIRIHLGTTMEIDLEALERDRPEWSPDRDDDAGGVAIATRTADSPTRVFDAEIQEPSEYEVNIYTRDEMRLVAAIEIVSPSNKDRPDNRETFANECRAFLGQDACVSIIDPVTERASNLYGDLLELLKATRTDVSNEPIYAVTCWGRRRGSRWRIESWEYKLGVGKLLPTLPIWISPRFKVDLDLEATYEETCRSLRIR